MKDLIKYLIDNLMLDFQGDLTLAQVRDFLRNADDRESRALLSRLVEDRGTEDMMLSLADCLKDYIRTGITDDVVREQLKIYSQS